MNDWIGGRNHIQASRVIKLKTTRSSAGRARFPESQWRDQRLVRLYAAVRHNPRLHWLRKEPSHQRGALTLALESVRKHLVQNQWRSPLVLVGVGAPSGNIGVHPCLSAFICVKFFSPTKRR
jgi:hypothetical protein